MGTIWIGFVLYLAITLTSLGGAGLVFPFLLILVVIGAEWLFHRLRKARLLGQAIKVTPDSFPDIHAEIVELRRRLDYHRPVDVYVLDEVKGNMEVTSLLGTRVLLIKGELAAALQDDGPASLRFLLGHYIGWLKARHGQLTLYVVVLDYLRWLSFVLPWMLPYWRCSKYTCDQFGYLCAEDLHASLGVIARLVVGADAGPRVPPAGVLEQAHQVSRRPLSRYAELFQSEPHLVKRYVNLVAFAGAVMPADHERFVAGLDEKGRRILRELLIQSPHHRSPASRPRPAAHPG
ncbi:M48 family metallopeptidase [Streptomyces iakyrus]|uniref:M48 family metallopeptidase n=1 Tax=Streptomyces iakyrus TaxID=68219 RepID=UPI0036A59DEE